MPKYTADKYELRIAAPARDEKPVADDGGTGVAHSRFAECPKERRPAQ